MIVKILKFPNGHLLWYENGLILEILRCLLTTILQNVAIYI